jgi:hypothetical protein
MQTSWAVRVHHFSIANDQAYFTRAIIIQFRFPFPFAVSVDSQFSHLAWLETPRKQGGLGRINYPLLSDLSRSMARDYGVLMEVGHSLRGLFIIDPKGVIRHITMNDPPVSRNAEEVLRLVKAYQYTDSHGEVCPAGWKKPGDATIVPNPTGKLEYAMRVCKLLLHDLCMTSFVLYFQILPIDQQVERQTRVSSQSFLCCVDG